MTVSLRELLTAATPGPWEEFTVVDKEDVDARVIMACPPEESWQTLFTASVADAALVVSLRNQAEALADLIDAAQALSDDEESQEGGWGPDVTMLIPLRAALSRLAATEPQPEEGGNRVA